LSAGVVVDASVALSWCYPDERNDYGDRVLVALRSRQGFVPSLWRIELANALLVGERRNRLTPADRARFLDLLSDLPIEHDTETAARALGETSLVARTYGLSVYDATYLELAMRMGVPLATLDQPLKKAARKAGVRLLA
jgi:predicted nucleic acid-binding protein